MMGHKPLSARGPGHTTLAASAAVAALLAAANPARAQLDPPSDNGSNGPRLLGIDVSAWQTDITTTEWATLKRPTNQQVNGVFGDGRDFVFIRSSRGGTTGFYNQSNAGNDNPPGQNTFSQRYDDPYYIRNITRATAAGLYAGSYHFARPDIVEGTLNSGGIRNTGLDEANHFLQMAGPWMRPGYLMPVLDMEAGQAQRTGQELADFSIQFANRIYEMKGIRPAVYINGNYANDLDAESNQATRDALVASIPTLWSARWPNQSNPGAIQVQTAHPKDTYSPIYGTWDNNPNGPEHPWVFWQYASTMRLNGNNLGGSNTDVNVVHGNMEYLKDQLIPAVWRGPATGNWKDLANWNSGETPVAPVQGPGQVARFGAMTLPGARLPGTPDPNNAANLTNVTGADDTVNLISPTQNLVVTFDSATPATNIRKLNLSERLNVTGGSLNVNRFGLVMAGGTMALSGGTVIIEQATFETGSALEFTGGGTLGVRLLKLGTNVTYSGSSGTGVINAKAGAVSPSVDLLGASRTFTVANGSTAADMHVSIPIANGQLTKAGAGTLVLSAANTYAGGTTISAGTIQLGNGTGTNGSLGTGAVTNNATLALNFGTSAATVANNMSGTGSLTKTGSGAVTLSGTVAHSGGTTVSAGTLTANNGFKGNGPLSIATAAKAVVPQASPSAFNPGAGQYPSGSNATASRVSSLTITGTGQLDLGNSDLVIDHGGSSPLNTVRSLLASGYNGGNWNGAGIISSGALATDPFTFALGYAENASLPLPFGTQLGGPSFFGQDVDSTALLVKFTWIGDLTLDGVIDFQDLSLFNGSYDAGATGGKTWLQGDLNYDGFTDFQDLSLFNANYNPFKPSLPEPAGLGALAVLTAAAVGRRRRNA